MKEGINRISIVGGSGTGKTTLSENMAKELNMPVYHLDGINYHKNWVSRDKQERDKMILEKINEEKWIIDGTYLTTVEKRLNKSDLIIYLDYSSFAQIRGVMGRFFKYHGKEKAEIPGCNEQMNSRFFFCVLNWRKNKRAELMGEVKKIDQSKVIIFKNRRQLNKWYQKEFGKKITVNYNLNK